jgi:NAD(P)-dependent dehydrogenase (short-subunit alcohol dehydrogenase family)
VKLEGKTAVITGAAGGMGRVACRMFCDEGARVLGVDLNEDAGRELEAELDGRDFYFMRCDVTSGDDAAAVAERVRDELGGLDVLYNNAGTIVGKSIVETTDEEWDRVLNVNLRSAFVMMRALVPTMRSGGSIVNISSGLGLVGEPNLTAYCASKGGLVMLTKSAALELGPAIRVNALCPGVIDTPMPRGVAASLPAGVGDQLLKGWEEQHLVRRLGRPEEVVSLGVWLASDDASFVSGAVIPVDSGVTAR